MEPSVNSLELKRRKAKIINTCLAIETNPHYVQFEVNKTVQLSEDHASMAGIVMEKTDTSIEVRTNGYQ